MSIAAAGPLDTELKTSDPAALRQLLHNPDAELRLQALRRLYRLESEQALPDLELALKDKEEFIRRYALKCLSLLAKGQGEASGAAERLLHQAEQKDPSVILRILAGRLQPWPFKRKNLRLSEDPNWDYDVKLISRQNLPEDQIKFRTDPENVGHTVKWYATDFPDQDWQPSKLGFWKDCGFPDYQGYAWYRIRFQAPAKPDCHSAELSFGGVAQLSWVWLNGSYIGEHNIGGAAFALDCRDEIRWGAENVLVLRVFNPPNEWGGIYRGIELEIFKSDGI
ncbi:MAG: beta galactosidase jelly roll domain-containing protein [Lentisphaeria bacterium]|nr:beta galactosidase jelly roll domain-containing protein [Lentisphaeria bacterium]